MITSIDSLAAELEMRAFQLSNLAVQNDGKVLYQVDDVFMTLKDANDVAQGLATPEGIRQRNQGEIAFASLAFLAAAKDVVSIAKTAYDVTKDGWQALKQSSDLQVDVLNSYSSKDGHGGTLLLTNLCGSGIYLESAGLAQENIEESERLSLRQPAVRMHLLQEVRGGMDTPGDEQEKRGLPELLSARISPNDWRHLHQFKISLPKLFHQGKQRTYAAIELVYSRLDEPASRTLSFTFRLR